MPYTIYDHVSQNGENTIMEWAKGLGADRVKFESKLNMIRTAGFDLPPKLLSDTNSPHIKKLRFFGQAKIQWRPMLCRGPIDNQTEATVLVGAHEKGSKLVPLNADHDAERLRQQIITDPKNRRCHHARIT